MTISIHSILFILGLVLSKVALLMYIPTLYAFFTHTAGLEEFLKAVIITHLVAIVLLSISRKEEFQLKIRDMFLTTTLIWVVCCCFSALPLIFISHIPFTDAFFETMSGLTTTGSSVLNELENQPPSVLLWRSLLEGIGGLGFIVMAVAILPFLDVGGMKLFHTESSDWSNKSSPRARDIAKNILQVYVVLTCLCFLGYRFAGMNNFDAFNYALSTISTGGFTPNDASMAGYSAMAAWNGTLFMYLGSLPFLLFVRCLQQRSMLSIFKDQQVIGFTTFILLTGFIISLWLWYQEVFDFQDSLRISYFNLVNLLSTTGFSLGNFDTWTPFTTVIFAIVMLFGGCSGSTTGGIKIFRFQICLHMFIIQIKKLIHPGGIFPRSYNGNPISSDLLRSIIAFILAFLGTIITIACILALCGIDAQTSLTGAITAVSNVGPGLGNRIGPSGNFSSLPELAKWALAIGMLLGRLEVLTVLVLFFPTFWRK